MIIMLINRAELLVTTAATTSITDDDRPAADDDQGLPAADGRQSADHHHPQRSDVGAVIVVTMITSYALTKSCTTRPSDTSATATATATATITATARATATAIAGVVRVTMIMMTMITTNITSPVAEMSAALLVVVITSVSICQPFKQRRKRPLRHDPDQPLRQHVHVYHLQHQLTDLFALISKT